jgi:hypothetical protein
MLSLAALCGGCMAAPPVPPSGNVFDGRYVGQAVLVRGDTRADINAFPCGPPSYAATVTVHDGWFEYSYAVDPLPAVPIPVQIAADGSFGIVNYFAVPSDDPAWVTVRGSVANGVLEATISNYRCSQHLMAQSS